MAQSSGRNGLETLVEWRLVCFQQGFRPRSVEVAPQGAVASRSAAVVSVVESARVSSVLSMAVSSVQRPIPTGSSLVTESEAALGSAEALEEEHPRRDPCCLAVATWDSTVVAKLPEEERTPMFVACPEVPPQKLLLPMAKSMLRRRQMGQLRKTPPFPRPILESSAHPDIDSRSSPNQDPHAAPHRYADLDHHEAPYAEPAAPAAGVEEHMHPSLRGCTLRPPDSVEQSLEARRLRVVVHPVSR